MQWSDFSQNFFGKTMRKKNVFGGIVGRSAEISAAQPQMKFQKSGKSCVKIQKICTFFSQMRPELSHHASKNIFFESCI